MWLFTDAELQYAHYFELGEEDDDELTLRGAFLYPDFETAILGRFKVLTNNGD